METVPEVTVVVPVYNAEVHLRECVDSILNQTFQNVELILVDDGSSDGSAAICDAYAAQHGNVRVFHQKNQGVAAARNAGLQNARGEYVSFVDSDDWLEPDALRIAIEQSRSKRLDLYIMGYRRVVEQTEGQPELYEKTGDGSVLMIDDAHSRESQNALCALDAAGFLYSCWGKLFRREWIADARFTLGDSYGEDSIFVLDCLEHGARLRVGSKPLYDYREQADGLVRGFRAGKSDDIAVLHRRLLSFYDRSILDVDNLAFFHRRFANDVLWAMDTAFAPAPRISLEERLDFLMALSNTPSRSICLQGVKQAASSRVLKILFIVNNRVLWKWYVQRRVQHA